MDKRLETAAESFLTEGFKAIGNIIKGIFRGMKKLTRLPPWIGLFISVLIVFLGRVLRVQIMSLNAPVYIRYLIYFAMLGAPLIYLYALGGGKDKSGVYEKAFMDIAFVGKDGKVPVFCGSVKEGKKEILSFKSNIPLTEWKSAEARLETALDCNILRIESGNSKKIVKLTVLPSDFKLQEKVYWDDSLCSKKSGTLIVGQGLLGNLSFDLNRTPHVLVAGETGSGKSVILRCFLWQMINQGSRVYMIDFKGGVEFGKQYEQYGEVITDRNRALEILNMLVVENESRLNLFREMEVKNLDEYNRKTGKNLCRIGVFTDELAEMLDKKGVSKEQRQIYEAIEGKLSTFARLSRATGINLFLGVQRPDANVLTGQIKNNIPVRISGRFADKTASEIVLGNTDAVDLPDIKGRFLYKVGNETITFQAFMFDDDTMLHEVFVEVGSMLTEPESESKTPQKQADTKRKMVKPESQAEKATHKTKNVKRGQFTSKSKPKENPNQDVGITDYEQIAMHDKDAYPIWGDESEEVSFPVEEEFDDKEILGDLDFNYEEEPF